METFKLSLTEHFPFLGSSGAQPTLEAWLQEDITEGDCKGKLVPSPRPVMLILPGGGYHHIGRRDAEPIALHFMIQGFNCFVLNYSVAPHTYPQQLLETAAALELICQNKEVWNLDPERIVLCGFSAGGHLAASYCTVRTRPEITVHFPHPRPIKAAILGYPVTTCRVDNYHGGTYRNLLGMDTPTPEQLAPHCLESFVDPELTPPIFLWHTATDRSVPVNGSLRFCQALSEKNIPFELHIFPVGRHGTGTADRQGVHDYADPENVYISRWTGLARSWLAQFVL